MSVSASTEIIIGVRFKPDALKKTIKTKSCNHSNPEGLKFCGECGKPIYTEKKVSIFDIEVEDKLHDYKQGEIYCTGTYDIEDVYIGIRLSYLSEEWETEVDLSGLEEKKDKLLSFFKENNLEININDIKIYHLFVYC
jgi:hypothetical protein